MSDEDRGQTDAQLVAIPCESGEDLEAERSAHFGKAPAFAVVRLEDDEVVAWWIVDNARHGEPGHSYLSGMFASEGVTDVVTAAIGTGMFQRLTDAGITVWIEQDAATVSSAIEAFVAGRAVRATADDVGHGR